MLQQPRASRRRVQALCLCSALLTTCSGGAGGARNTDESPGDPSPADAAIATLGIDPNATAPATASATGDAAGTPAPIVSDLPTSVQLEAGTAASEERVAAGQLRNTVDGTPQAPPRGDSTSDEGQVCWFEFLGTWMRCEESWGSAPYLDRVQDVRDCAEACLDDPDCRTITDYNWLGFELPCLLYRGPCTPSTGVSYEEDAGREYRKVCGDVVPPDAITSFSPEPGLITGSSSGCRFLPIAEYTACEDDVPAEAASSTGASLEECLLACEANPDCSAVKDWWLGGPTSFECALHTSTCDSPVAITSADVARFYRKVCD